MYHQVSQSHHQIPTHPLCLFIETSRTNTRWTWHPTPRTVYYDRHPTPAWLTLCLYVRNMTSCAAYEYTGCHAISYTRNEWMNYGKCFVLKIYGLSLFQYYVFISDNHPCCQQQWTWSPYRSLWLILVIMSYYNKNKCMITTNLFLFLYHTIIDLILILMIYACNCKEFCGETAIS